MDVKRVSIAKGSVYRVDFFFFDKMFSAGMLLLFFSLLWFMISCRKVPINNYIYKDASLHGSHLG